MPDDFKFYGQFNLPKRTTQNESIADFDRLTEILEAYAPDLLGRGLDDKLVPGGDALWRKTP